MRMKTSNEKNMKRHFLPIAAIMLALTLTTLTNCRKKPADNTPAQEGLYLGIIGFNSELNTMPLGLLNQNTKTVFQRFVDGLTMQDGTILYHAVNTGLNSLATAKLPANLTNVSVVTFTDGLDQGSYVLGGYASGDEYLNAVSSRIRNELVGGVNISAYSIGVRGSDVSLANMTDFRNNLKKLASNDQHVFEVNNMSQASVKFAEIAQQLFSQNIYYNVSLKIPAQNPNTRIRFTFDNVGSASLSQRYIEGVYVRNGDHGQLTEVTYHGLQCQSGSTVTATSQGIFDVFTFRDLLDPLDKPLNTDNVKFWSKPNQMSLWESHSEFTSSGNSHTVSEYRSAMIMLVLDCSSSLGSDFVNMKTAANSFIETLSGNYSGQ